MSEIIEDTITRNRKFREERLKRIKRLKEMNVPKEILEHEEYIAGMTVAEFEIYELKCIKEDNKTVPFLQSRQISIIQIKY